MHGHWNRETAHYRCRYPAEYALANKVEHPRTVYLREDAVVPKLDEWLLQLFDEDHLDETCEALAVASEVDEATEARAEGARHKIADCDRRLAKYRAALQADVDPAMIAGWMAALRDIVAVLANADPRLKAEVYAELGVSITYNHEKRLVVAEATGVQQNVSERGLEPLRPCGH